jgi:hypothetical protein
VIFGIIIFAVERTIRSSIEAVITSTTGNRVYAKSVPRVRISPAAPKRTLPCWVVFFFCIQRFEQGMSEAKKRPSGAFSARLHRRGITIDATCPVPSIVPLPRKRLTFSATGSVSPLSVSRCGNTASESLLLRQIKPPSFDGGFIFYSALSANWAFLPLLPQHLSCGEDGVANALRAGTEDLAGLHAL